MWLTTYREGTSLRCVDHTSVLGGPQAGEHVWAGDSLISVKRMSDASERLSLVVDVKAAPMGEETIARSSVENVGRSLKHPARSHGN